MRDPLQCVPGRIMHIWYCGKCTECDQGRKEFERARKDRNNQRRRERKRVLNEHRREKQGSVSEG